MVESIKQFFLNTFSNPYIATLLIAVLPIVELRGAIPFGFLYYKGVTAVNIWGVAACGYLGSALVAPLVLLALIPLLNWLKKTRLFRGLATALEKRFTAKSEKLKAKAVAKAAAKRGEEAGELTEEERLAAEARVDKTVFWSKFFGVMTFVAIPLPFTGVWTGSAVAAFLKMKFRWGLIAVLIGNLIACTIITLMTFFLGWVI